MKKLLSIILCLALLMLGFALAVILNVPMRALEDVLKKLAGKKYPKHERPEFDPQVGKILWSRKWQLVSVFLLGKSMDRGVWKAATHWITKSQT